MFCKIVLCFEKGYNILEKVAFFSVARLATALLSHWRRNYKQQALLKICFKFPYKSLPHYVISLSKASCFVLFKFHFAIMCKKIHTNKRFREYIVSVSKRNLNFACVVLDVQTVICMHACTKRAVKNMFHLGQS